MRPEEEIKAQIHKFQRVFKKLKSETAPQLELIKQGKDITMSKEEILTNTILQQTFLHLVWYLEWALGTKGFTKKEADQFFEDITNGIYAALATLKY